MIELMVDELFISMLIIRGESKVRSRCLIFNIIKTKITASNEISSCPLGFENNLSLIFLQACPRLIAEDSSYRSKALNAVKRRIIVTRGRA